MGEDHLKKRVSYFFVDSNACVATFYTLPPFCELLAGVSEGLTRDEARIVINGSAGCVICHLSDISKNTHISTCSCYMLK